MMSQLNVTEDFGDTFHYIHKFVFKILKGELFHFCQQECIPV